MNFLTAILLFPLLLQSVDPTKPPKIGFKAHPTLEAVAPGSTVEVVLQLDIPKPWHMYHAIILDTGMPTAFEFTLPEGVSVGPVQYPTPIFGSLADIEYLEIKDKVLCVVPVTVAKSVKPDTKLDVSVSMSGLACVEACVQVEAKTKFSLPVKAESGPPANAELLKSAKEKFPAKLSEAPYLKGSKVEISKSKLGLKDKAEIVATLKVEGGHHIQDKDPGVEGLIGARFFVEARDGIEIAKLADQKWPEPKVRKAKGVGEVRELAGEVTVRIPIEITDDQFPSGPVELRVLLRYQACTEAGVCYPPAMAEETVRFVADTPTKAKDPPLGEKVGGATGGSDVAATGSGNSTTAAPGAAASTPLAAVGIDIWFALLFAFLGGLLMNVMPCVLPVISIKIVSFVEQSGDHPERVFRLGLAFAMGVLAWFWVMAAIAGFGSLQLRSQFQNPLQNVTVVMTLTTIVFVMALNLFGVFEIALPGAATGTLDAASRKEGYPGAFSKGFLATILGTACTAPFIGSAFAYALTQPLAITFLVFTVAGIGMAFPYVVLAANPKWMRFVPKPGKWMVAFKQSMGFFLAGTAVWLLWVMRKHVGADGVVLFTGFLTFVSLGAWYLGRGQMKPSGAAHLASLVVAIAICAVGWYTTMVALYDPASARPQQVVAKFDDAELGKLASSVRAADWKKIPWVHYQPGLAEALAERGYSVYVDFTADWCFNCKANLKTVLETDDVRAKMKQLGVIPIEADYTTNDPDMRKDIEKIGRISVPVNLVYPAGKPGSPALLPEILRSSVVLEALDKAGPSKAISGEKVAAKIP